MSGISTTTAQRLSALRQLLRCRAASRDHRRSAVLSTIWSASSGSVPRAPYSTVAQHQQQQQHDQNHHHHHHHHHQQQSAAPFNRLREEYSRRVSSGALVADAAQERVVARLARLLHELDAYAHARAAHAAEDAEWRARAAARLAELERQEAAADEAAAQAAAAEVAAAAKGASSSSWLPSALSSWLLSSSAAADARPPSPASAAARVHRAAAERRAARVLRELGRPAPAPAAPRGVYIHGGVGSGKTMLMDMFYAAATQATEMATTATTTTPLPSSPPAAAPLLRYARRLHFTAALVEMHQRLHLLEKMRRRQLEQEEEEEEQQEEAAAAAALEQEEEQQQQEDSHASQIERTVREGSGEARRQRAARAAVLAVRRHLRAQRLGRVSRSSLEISDAEIMRLAVRSLVRAPQRQQGPPGADAAAEMARLSAGGFAEAAADAALARGATTPSLPYALLPPPPPAGALVAFDEVQIVDPFAAVTLRSLTFALADEGCVLVATSNRAPHLLPRHGLHEALFDAFVDRLVESVDVVCLGGSGSGGDDLLAAGADGGGEGGGGDGPQQQQQHRDYRRLALSRALGGNAGGGEAASIPSVDALRRRDSSLCLPTTPPYFWPLGPDAQAAMDARWAELTTGAEAAATPLMVDVGFGRSLQVRRWAQLPDGRRAARFSFTELCGGPRGANAPSPAWSAAAGAATGATPTMLGPADYLALAASFDVVFVDGVPRLSASKRDYARRFITLVDELYNRRRVACVSAAAPPERLFGRAAAAATGGGGGGRGGRGGAAAATAQQQQQQQEEEEEESEEALLDLEQLMFETAAEDAKLRRDVTASGGVAPVAASEQARLAAAAVLGGEEERFAFARAVSRLQEMMVVGFGSGGKESGSAR